MSIYFRKTKEKLTVEELCRVFEKFQLKHPDCYNMQLRITSYRDGENICAGIWYNDGCYYSGNHPYSMMKLYELMLDEID